MKNHNFTGNISDGFTLFWHSKSPFSQWHPSVFVVKGIWFTSSEQWMMFCKAKFFKDDFSANQIIALNTQENVLNSFLTKKICREDIFSNRALHAEWDAMQKKIKSIGRTIKPYVEQDWANNRVRLVRKGNLEKFSQNNDLKSILIETGKTRLVECNPYDKIWSCGLRPENPMAKNPDGWIGADLLGKILTDLKLTFQSEAAI
jgi:ribA/ribD-fused uncharacterized protein